MTQVTHESNLVGEALSTYDQWYICRVLMAGPAENGVISIMLKDIQSDTPKFCWWFCANRNIKTEMLSVALTAITASLPVQVALTDTKEYSQINRMYLKTPEG